MKPTQQPIELFKNWYGEELNLTKVQIPSAVCLSTIGVDDFPNARFVSFKEIIDDSFVITGPLNSRKGIEINNNNCVSLTFWWTETERQVRIQGYATKISEQLANAYFKKRNRNSKAISNICEQCKETNDIELLEKMVLDKVGKEGDIEKPKNWSGFSIKPIRIEFMQFETTRFHNRKLFELVDENWTMKQIQP